MIRLAGTFAVAMVVSNFIGTPADASTVTVEPGQTITSIAHAHGLTIGQLLSLNPSVRNPDQVRVGQTLTVPDPLPITVEHRVVAGDTLIGIARQYGVPTAQIVSDNHLSPSGTVYAGTTLVIHESAAPSPATDTDDVLPVHHDYPPAVLSAAARDRAAMSTAAAPSRSAVRSLVSDTARRFGVDPNLALAVADQESGFNQKMVSDADAIGTMQVLPGTARQMASLAGRALDPMNTGDNVEAGVLLLGALTRAAPLDQAVAGYYQGLDSVRAHGVYPDTRRYVADVLALRRAFATGER